MTKHLSEEASFFRAALLPGLLPGSTVVKWAETAIDSLDNPPHPLLELVSILPEDITGLRYALLDLCTETITVPVLHGILGLVFNDLDTGKRSLGDTVTVLSQLRRFNRLDPALYRQLLNFEVQFDAVRQTGSVTAFGRKLLEWLRQYRSPEMEPPPPPR